MNKELLETAKYYADLSVATNHEDIVSQYALVSIAYSLIAITEAMNCPELDSSIDFDGGLIRTNNDTFENADDFDINDPRCYA